RPELARSGGSHCVVDERHALADLTLCEEDPPPILQREGPKVGISHPERDRCRLFGQRQCSWEIPLHLQGERRLKPEQPPMLRRLGELREVPLRSTEPPLTHR